ncbi:hybrid sensor histidine kinase/response regulator [Sulfurimonas sp.]|uniref:hybrid sensor histidine kinase/response regulator n=1 Tax=Sulfurimonas sp. TaxID=2022749 RepID=UPI0025D17A96|nr:hybrid sensor histidine kinase/response regulator [Sulfurimonas sp.]
MKSQIPNLSNSQDIFIKSKDFILLQWLSYDSPKKILKQHNIDKQHFLDEYASGVFDYFMEIIDEKVDLQSCPIMESLLSFLKQREISADELFEICSYFRRSMVDFSYDKALDSKDMANEISYIFDKCFREILKNYTDSIFQKLTDARLETDKASRAKEFFLSNMSHEIRTPLNAILGFVKLLIEEDVSKKHRRYLDIILNSGENLLSIINDILDFSKLRSGEFTIEPKIFELHDEITHTMELFVASANAKEITITSYIDPYIPKELYADALRIKQILSNFLSNAVKFTPRGGHISVEAYSRNGTLTLSVRDNGVGIAENDIKNIFTAFTQVKFSDQKFLDGTGLGLSISHQLAKHMNGNVHATSSLGSGSRFWVDIPVVAHSELCPISEDVSDFTPLKIVVYSKKSKNIYKEESFMRYADVFGMNAEIVDNLDCYFDIALFIEDDVDKEFISNAINSDKKFIAMASKASDKYDKYNHIVAISFPLYCSKIRDTFSELFNPDTYVPREHELSTQYIGHLLVAEDNEANQELIKIILLKYGLSFDIAVNGHEAVEFYKKNNYDFILMDEQMPIMDGTEAVKKISKYEIKKGLRHTPVSALTANVIKGAKERGLSSGYDSFLGKPIILKELEKVFALYLKVDTRKVREVKNDIPQNGIIGLDSVKLKKDLMLSDEELIMLLSLFIKKMKKQIPELSKLIDRKDYRKIALSAHSIRGSSGNFRIECIQKDSSEMESMAKSENSEYNYREVFDRIKSRVEEIKIA